jgi:hypothetical protein
VAYAGIVTAWQAAVKSTRMPLSKPRTSAWLRTQNPHLLQGLAAEVDAGMLRPG